MKKNPQTSLIYTLNFAGGTKLIIGSSKFDFNPKAGLNNLWFIREQKLEPFLLY